MSIVHLGHIDPYRCEKEFFKFGIFLTLESWRIKADFFSSFQ